MAASALVGLVSMLLIVVELCRANDMPAALRFMVVLRTGACVRGVIVFSVFVLTAYLLVSGHVYLRYTSTVYTVFTRYVL